MNCPTCGTTLPDGANFCPKCGRLVQGAPAPSKGMPRWLIALLVVAALLIVSLPFLAIFAAILIPNFIHARAEAQLSADEANLKQVAIAVEEFAVDHNGRYPDNLPQLVPTYIKTLPTVPGGDGTGAYDYHHPASSPLHGAYDIWDDGSMDVTTLRNLPRDPAHAAGAAECKYVIFAQGRGLMCVPGQE